MFTDEQWRPTSIMSIRALVTDVHVATTHHLPCTDAASRVSFVHTCVLWAGAHRLSAEQVGHGGQPGHEDCHRRSPTAVQEGRPITKSLTKSLSQDPLKASTPTNPLPAEAAWPGSHEEKKVCGDAGTFR